MVRDQILRKCRTRESAGIFRPAHHDRLYRDSSVKRWKIDGIRTDNGDACVT
jgi:hypothetical protein